MSINLIDKIKPKGEFYIADSKDIEHNGKSLDSSIPKVMTQSEYDVLVENNEVSENTLYVIVESSEGEDEET